MNVYIYDTFLSEGKYVRTMSRIEGRITDLGLNGKIARLGVMKKTQELVRDEIKRGAKTIIAVGNDDTVEKIVRCMPETAVPLGIIPIGKKNCFIAEALGIDPELEACEILSARRVERMDLGLIGNFRFLSRISSLSENLTLNIDSGYSVRLSRRGVIISIVNLPTKDLALPETTAFNPQDGLLQLLIETRDKKRVIFDEKNFESVFTFTKMTLKGEQGPVIFNDLIKVSGSMEVSAIPKAISIIVGKNRRF